MKIAETILSITLAIAGLYGVAYNISQLTGKPWHEGPTFMLILLLEVITILWAANNVAKLLD